MTHQGMLAPRYVPVVCVLGLVALFGPTAYVQPAFDVKAAYEKSEVMVPMRDGTRLFTIIYSPRNGSSAIPFCWHARRTASPRCTAPAPTAPVIGPSSEVRDSGLHRLTDQDVRGKFKSEGELRPPLHSPIIAGLDEAEREHRPLRHDRLAGEERPQQQRPCRAMGHLLGSAGRSPWG